MQQRQCDWYQCFRTNLPGSIAVFQQMHHFSPALIRVTSHWQQTMKRTPPILMHHLNCNLEPCHLQNWLHYQLSSSYEHPRPHAHRLDTVLSLLDICTLLCLGLHWLPALLPSNWAWPCSLFCPSWAWPCSFFFADLWNLDWINPFLCSTETLQQLVKHVFSQFACRISQMQSCHEKESVNPKEPVNLLTTLCFCLGQRCRPALTPTTQAARTPWLTPTLARSQKRKSEPEDASSTYSMIDTETSKIPEKTVWAWRYNQTMTIKGLHVKQDPRKECLSLKIQPNRPGVPSIQSVGNIAFFVWAIN